MGTQAPLMKCQGSASVMGLWVSSPSSAVLQRVTPSPWSYLDVQHRSADTWADRRVDGTNAALSAARRASPRHNDLRRPPPPVRPHPPDRLIALAPQYRAAGVMLPSVVGAGPPHYAVRKGGSGPISGAWCARAGAHSTPPGLTASRVPATGPRTSITDPVGLPETQSASLAAARRGRSHLLSATRPQSSPCPSRTRCRPATCGAECRPACAPAPPSPA